MFGRWVKHCPCYLVSAGATAARDNLAETIVEAKRINDDGFGAWIMGEGGETLWPKAGPKVSKAYYLYRRLISESRWQDHAPTAYVRRAADLAITSPFIVPAGGDIREAFRKAFGYVRDTFDFPEAAEIYPC